MSDRQITHVAILYEGKAWSLPKPNRHHHVIREIARANGVGINGPDVQGFLDDSGTFLCRRAAFKLASTNGQLARRPGGYSGDQLFSEDLW